MMQETFSRRFIELRESFAKIPFQHSARGGSSYVPHGQWEKWATSAQNLILAVYGETSPHYRNFVNSYAKCRGDVP